MLFPNRIRVTMLVCFILLIANGVVLAQPGIDQKRVADNIKGHVEYLCSPVLMGRSTLSGHDVLAAQYIDSLFTTYSLMGLPNFDKPTYSQRFNVYNTILANDKLMVNDSFFMFKENFAYTGKIPPREREIEVVFGGVFTEQGFKDLDLNGKALLVFVEKLGLALFYIQQYVKDSGCELVLIANPQNDKDFFRISQNVNADKAFANFSIDQNIENPIRSFMPSSRDNKPVVFISNRVAHTILGISPEDLMLKPEESERDDFPNNTKSIVFTLDGVIETYPTQNVIGYIPSHSKTQQSVVVGAHFDHLEPKGDRWYPGADDNASGTAVMLEVARLISEDMRNGYTPTRNIVFAGFTAEEIGLLGSQYYSLNPLFSTDSTAAFINVDMVGRPSKQDNGVVHIYLNGKNRIGEFAQVLNYLHNDSTLVVDSETLPGSSIYSLSDHYHYDRLGLPSYILTTGLHGDYHRPTDTPEKLSYDGMANLVEIVYNAIKHFADTENPWDAIE